MWNFSSRQRLHFFVLLEYECALPRIFHVILYAMFFSFSDQMYLLNSVAFLSLWFENDCLWLAYRSFELRVCQPNVCLAVVVIGVVGACPWGGHCGLVNNAFGPASAIQWAIGFVATIAIFGGLCCWFLELCLIVRVDGVFHVWHAAVR